MHKFGWWKDKDNRDSVSAIVGLLKIVVPAGLTFAVAVIAYLGLAPEPPETNPSPPAISVTGPGNAVQTGGGTQVLQGDNSTATINQGLSEEGFLALLERRETEIRADVDRAHTAEQEVLRAQLAEIEYQKANLNTAYAETLQDLRDLRLRLADFKGQVPRDRLEAAQAALYAGERDEADALLAELEDQMQNSVKLAAEAATTRGQIAEQEIRWADAANHYARAARLDPSFNSLHSARTFVWLSGSYAQAAQLGKDLLALARAEGDQLQLSVALNEHGLTLNAQGEFAEAEALYREALEIDRLTIGEEHPDHAIHLSNLAAVVLAQGRYEEAESLQRQALQIGRATIGEEHPTYAIHLNQLARVVRVRGRFEEAEGLLRRALEIDRATIGEGHPEYATRLHNLADVVQAQGRIEEAEGLIRNALEIDRATIGEGHPAYAARLNGLALIVQAQGRFEEVERFYREALKIGRATIGEGHLDYAIRLGNLGQLLGQQGKTAEAREMLQQAMEIFRATLPPDHPFLAETQRRIGALPPEED
ncbi:tetratricopeptide repeat protein [uncultured Roseobacter sp.]|uniref:tetratricopeptide repeat protein n=1 Tax=uncultured Roseobacter sp. TaxID=114847 RepID=UPI0026330740|nr:tetratricopeptide repeat protein [uncultured Roseobacter sp.]